MIHICAKKIKEQNTILLSMDSDVDRQKTFHFFCEREQDIRINVTMIFNAKIIIYQPSYFAGKKVFLLWVIFSRILINQVLHFRRGKKQNFRDRHRLLNFSLPKLQFSMHDLKGKTRRPFTQPSRA